MKIFLRNFLSFPFFVQILPAEFCRNDHEELDLFGRVRLVALVAQFDNQIGLRRAERIETRTV